MQQHPTPQNLKETRVLASFGRSTIPKLHNATPAGDIAHLPWKRNRLVVSHAGARIFFPTIEKPVLEKGR